MGIKKVNSQQIITTPWSGQFMFGRMWAAYRGPSSENRPHAHAALQLVLPVDGIETPVVYDGNGESINGALVIRPLIRHSLAPAEDSALAYVEPQSPIALEILAMVADVPIATLPASILRRFDTSRPVDEWFGAFRNDASLIDPRLNAALNAAAETVGVGAVAAAARACGLSESRLRVIVHQEMGVPLSRWLIWRKLERTGRALADGRGLADAAAEGGFVDQSHFSRCIREMFGVTPKVAQNAFKQS